MTAIPREDLRLACAPDRAQAVHAQRRYFELERHRLVLESRDWERERVQRIHEAAVLKRVDALRRGEFVPLPGPTEYERLTLPPPLGGYNASGMAYPGYGASGYSPPDSRPR